jgi:glycosidase
MLERARAHGIPNFHICGEVATGDLDPARLAAHTRVDKLPAVLDFAFGVAVNEVISGKKGTDELSKLFMGDSLYEGGEETARRLPTFLGNHDAGRVAMFLTMGDPRMSANEALRRDMLGHAMLLLLRGVPTIYSGDEQGFIGHGGDQAARQDMFASHVASYNDQPLLGTTSTTAVANFNRDHPLFKEIATLARLRTSHPALTRGRQLIRAAGDKPGLFAVSRFDPVTGAEMLLAFNSSGEPWSGNIQVEAGSAHFTALAGACPAAASAPGSVALTIPAFGYAVCAAGASQ